MAIYCLDAKTGAVEGLSVLPHQPVNPKRGNCCDFCGRLSSECPEFRMQDGETGRLLDGKRGKACRDCLCAAHELMGRYLIR